MKASPEVLRCLDELGGLEKLWPKRISAQPLIPEVASATPLKRAHSNLAFLNFLLIAKSQLPTAFISTAQPLTSDLPKPNPQNLTPNQKANAVSSPLVKSAAASNDPSSLMRIPSTRPNSSVGSSTCPIRNNFTMVSNFNAAFS